MSKQLLKILDENGFTAYNLKSGNTKPLDELVTVENRLAGIAELMLASDLEHFVIESLTGVGSLLSDLANSVGQVRSHLDESACSKERVKRRSRPKKRARKRVRAG